MDILKGLKSNPEAFATSDYSAIDSDTAMVLSQEFGSEISNDITTLSAAVAAGQVSPAQAWLLQLSLLLSCRPSLRQLVAA